MNIECFTTETQRRMIRGKPPDVSLECFVPLCPLWLIRGCTRLFAFDESRFRAMNESKGSDLFLCFAIPDSERHRLAFDFA